MKSSSTGVFQDAGWVTSDGGAASLILLAHCGGRGIALGERIKEIPWRDRAHGRTPSLGRIFRVRKQGCSVAGIPTHADLSVASLALG
jgi:hypothetical protein